MVGLDQVHMLDQGKQIKVHRSKKIDQRSHFQPVDPVHRSRETDQRSHFQTVDSSCGKSAHIKVRRSRKTDQRIPSKLDQGKPIHSKLWTVPVDQVHRSRKADQGAQITGKPIKEAIS
jgi:hypothetical protein